MDDDKLIECVQKYSVLYDMSHHKYLDSKYKIAIWKTIGNEINQSSEACRNRWTNIRDQFKKTLNKRKTLMAQGTIYVKKYKYEEALQFLLPHLQDRNMLLIDEDNNLSQDSLHDAEITECTELEIDDPAMFVEPVNPSQPNLSAHSSDLSQYTVESSPRNTPQRMRNRRQIRMAKPSTSTSRNSKKYLMENKNKTEDVHPIDAFFMGLAPTIKRFTPYHQHLARGRIFEVVQDIEWQQLSSEANSYSQQSPLSINPSSIATRYTSTPSSPQSPESVHSKSQALIPIDLPSITTLSARADLSINSDK